MVTDLKKRRPFQFGLRGWVFFITAVSLMLGIAGRCYDRVRRQHAAVGYLQSRGFSVTHQVPSGLTQMLLGETADSWPLWQRYLLLDVDSVGQSPVRGLAGPALGEEFWDQLSQFPRIESLSVGDPLPNGLRFNQMPFRRHIKTVSLRGRLSAGDIEQLSDCPQLVVLTIGVRVDGTGEALAGLARLRHLEQLTISHAPTEAVEAWCQWSTLQHLSVQRAGNVPAETWARLIENNSGLRTLSLAGVTTAYKVCDALKNSAELTSLDLTRSDVGDSGVEVLAILPRLETLHLGGTRVTGLGFEPVADEDWPALKTVRLPKAAVNLDGVRSLARLPHLRELDLSGNRLDDEAFCDSPLPFRLAKATLSATDITDATIEKLVADGVRTIVAHDTFATKDTARFLENSNRRNIHVSTRARH